MTVFTRYECLLLTSLEYVACKIRYNTASWSVAKGWRYGNGQHRNLPIFSGQLWIKYQVIGSYVHIVHCGLHHDDEWSCGYWPLSYILELDPNGIPRSTISSTSCRQTNIDCTPFGPIHETMQILQYQGKGTHLNNIERYFTYKEFSNNNHLNDEFNITPNKIFNALLKPH